MRRLLGLLLLACMAVPTWAEPQFRMFSLQHRFGQDLLPAIKPLVGAEGTASAIDNRLLIQASPERLQAIEQAIARLDTERRNLRIRVSHHRMSQSAGGGVEVRGGVRSGDVRVQLSRSPAPVDEGVALEIGRHEAASSQRTSEQLVVQEGERAVIAVGKSVPFTEYWLALGRRYAHVQQTVHYRDIATGFSVLPRLIGEEAELEIAPRIAQFANDGVIEFQELATTVRVPRGHWVDLGGIMGARDEVSRAILSHGNVAVQDHAELWLMVEW